MSKTIQLRCIPDTLHRRLKIRAAAAGMSLSDYVVPELRKIAECPTMEEISQRLATLPPVDLKISPTKVLREQRDGN